jgi:hypothetical protein
MSVRVVYVMKMSECSNGKIEVDVMLVVETIAVNKVKVRGSKSSKIDIRRVL